MQADVVGLEVDVLVGAVDAIGPFGVSIKTVLFGNFAQGACGVATGFISSDAPRVLHCDDVIFTICYFSYHTNKLL